MQEEARAKGWVDDGLPAADTSGLDPQRVWCRTSLKNTKYAGCLGAKSPVRGRTRWLCCALRLSVC